MYYINFIDSYFEVKGIVISFLPTESILKDLYIYFGLDMTITDTEGNLIATVFDGDIKWC